ncbi:MAG: hypothetical protein WB643_07345, partial [Candidatus Bathyarchaeia archaeon]
MDSTGQIDNVIFTSGMTMNLAGGVTYTITLGSDDGSRLFKDGVQQNVCSSWQDQSYATKQCTLQGDGSSHQFRLDYYEHTANARVSFSIVGSVVSAQIYVIAIPGAAASGVSDPQAVANEVSSVASQKALTVQVISSYDALDVLVRNPPSNVIVINAHGETVPMPASWGSSWQPYYDQLSSDVTNHGWILVSIVGYPLYWLTSPVQPTPTSPGPDGLNRFLSVVGGQANAWYTTTSTLTTAGSQDAAYFGVSVPASQTFPRAISWTGITPIIVYYDDAAATGASTVQMGSGYFTAIGLPSDASDQLKADMGLAFSLIVLDQVTITSNPSGSGFVTVDGSPKTTPDIETWVVGTNHTIAANAPVTCGTGCQYVWSSWSDGKAQSHTITVPLTSATFTASYNIQYALTISLNGHGTSTPLSGAWYIPGSYVQVTLGSDTSSNSSNTRYLYNGATGSGSGSHTGPEITFSVTMNAPITESVSWLTQYTITINLNGHGTSTPVSGTWENLGAALPVTIGSDGTNSSSIRNIIRTITGTGSGSFTGLGNSFTVTMNAPIVETITWATQYMLTADVNPSGSGAVTPSSGWQNLGALIKLSANAATGYAFSSWNGTGNGAYSGFNDPAMVKMNGPVNETANFHSLVAITLESGWNLISFPIVPNSTSIANLLRSQIASNEVVSVWAYSASSRSWHVFTPGKPSTLTTMTDGNGYWVYMRTDDTLYIDGNVIVPGSIPPTYALTQGWNLVGFKPQPTITSETVG